MNKIDELKSRIKSADKSYRNGTPEISDYQYDELVDELIELIGEDDEFFDSSIKEDIDDLNSDRREQLPIIMASLDKKKKLEAIIKYFLSKNLKMDTDFCILGKYDGISQASEEGDDIKNIKSWTRGGNGLGGLRSEGHLLAMNVPHIPVPYTYGEVIISKSNWNMIRDEYESDSSRNAISGMFRSDEPNEMLEYADFIRYGIVGKDFDKKSEMLDYLNGFQKIKVPYKVLKLEELTEELLYSLFEEYSKDYILDGLVIEVNDQKISKSLGRNRKNNLIGAIAFKSPSFEEAFKTTVLDIEYNVSKNGNIIPTCIFETTIILGTEVSRATLNNVKFMITMGLGIGSEILITKSGGVIPLIIRVLTPMSPKYPDIDYKWDNNKVHLKTLYDTPEQQIKKLTSFFKVLKVENSSDKTFELLYNSGFKTIKDILSMSKSDFLSLDRFGEAKADKIYDAIHGKMKNVSLSKLQHATNLFVGENASLGSKKLLLLEHFETKPTYDEVMKIEGFSDISTKIYLDNIDNFWEFIKDLPITIQKTQKVEKISNDLEGLSFCFSGYRSAEIELEIVRRGGTIVSGVSKKCTHLIIKQKNSSSSKEVKALELCIQILEPDELIEMLKS